MDVKSKAKETVSRFETQRKGAFIGTKQEPRSFRVLREKGITVRTGRRARAVITFTGTGGEAPARLVSGRRVLSHSGRWIQCRGAVL